MNVSSAFRAAGLCMLALLSATGGCAPMALWALVPAAQEIPPELNVILDDPERFRGDSDAPFESPTRGRPLGELTELGGCWGAYWETETTLGDRTFGVSQVLSIDPASGRLERFVYQEIVIAPALVTVQRGTLVLDGAGNATFDVEQILGTVNPALAGQLEDVTDRYSTLPRYTVRLRWDGDELLAYFEEEGTPRTAAGFADRITLRHKLFDCP